MWHQNGFHGNHGIIVYGERCNAVRAIMMLHLTILYGSSVYFFRLTLIETNKRSIEGSYKTEGIIGRRSLWETDIGNMLWIHFTHL
jgi:hypothetical protein